MPPAQVRKRCFVQMTGYEPVGAEHQHRRFIREMARFHKAWSVQGKVSPPHLSAGDAVASWTVDTFGPNWRVTTDFHWFRWDDFVRADGAKSDWLRFPLGIAALMEFILSGTVAKYFIIAWRYGGFFLFPLIYVVGMAWLSIGLTRFAVGHLGLPYPMVIAPALWLAIFVALRWTFGRFIHIGYALDDWYFARDFIHRARTARRRAARSSRRRIGAARPRDRRRRNHRPRPQSWRAAVALRHRPRFAARSAARRTRQAAACRLDRLVAAQSGAASGGRLAARGRRPGGECAGDLLGRVSGTGRHHQCL